MLPVSRDGAYTVPMNVPRGIWKELCTCIKTFFALIKGIFRSEQLSISWE